MEVQCLAYNVDGLARLRGISSEKEVRASWNPRIVSLGQLTQFLDTISILWFLENVEFHILADQESTTHMFVMVGDQFANAEG